MWKKMIAAIAVCFHTSAFGCPFCDQGGVDAARFIVAVFIPFALAMLFVLAAVLRHGKTNPSRDPSRRIFEAENRKEEP